MEKLSLDQVLIYLEFETFCHNPNMYFTAITDKALKYIRSEYSEYDIAKVLRQLKFFNLFVQNLDKLTPKNLSKIYTIASKEKHDIFQLLFGKVAMFTDLIGCGMFNDSSVLNKLTNEKHDVLYGVQANFKLIYDYVSGYLIKYKPELNEYQNGKLIEEVGKAIILSNPNDFESDFIKELDNSESLYS